MLGDSFHGVVQLSSGFSLQPYSESVFVLCAFCVRSRGFDGNIRLKPPKHERLQDGVRYEAVDPSIYSKQIVSSLMPAHAEIAGDYRKSGEYPNPKAGIVKIGYSGVVRTALVAPFGIRNERVVVVDELPADPHADPLCFGITGFGICKLEIPGVFVRRAQR